jgi:NADH:ubiquinone oxidoreductase subunit 6 (subunit J)
MNSAVLAGSFLGLTQVTAKAKMPIGTVAALAPERTAMAYLLPFEIVSVHLLVVLIGAAYLARAKRRRGAVS